MSVVALDDHRYRLGGSTIGAAVGVNPYVSPIRLWLELTTGQRKRDERLDVQAEWGRKIEPLILDAVDATSFDGAAFHHTERPWLVGHPDGFVTYTDMSASIIEAKCSARGYDSPPAHYIAQLQTYMHLTGHDHGAIATLAGLQLAVVGVEYSPHTVDTMLGLADAFMEHVRNGVQPAPSGHADDRAALLAVHPSAVQGVKVRETREVRDARRELVGLLDAEKRRKARIEHLRAIVTDYMGEAELLVDAHDAIVATWKGAPANRLDTDRLKKERPDIYAGFFNEGQTRRLVIK